MISKSLCDSVGEGGGIVAEFFRDLQKPMRFSGGGGGVVAEIFRGLQNQTQFSGGGGDSSAEFCFSVASKHNFPLMGPFYIVFISRKGGPGPPGPPLNRPLDVQMGMRPHTKRQREKR